MVSSTTLLHHGLQVAVVNLSAVRKFACRQHFQNQATRRCEIKGVGSTSRTTILASTPELVAIRAGSAAKPAGLVPLN